MSSEMVKSRKFGLEKHGLINLKNEYWNLSTPDLVEHIVARGEGVLIKDGAIAVRTGKHTGRAPNDKFIVKVGDAVENVHWGKANKPFSQEDFDNLHAKILSYFQGKDVFVLDAVGGKHPDYHLPIRVISEMAWASLFSRNLFLQRTKEELENHVPEFTLIHAPEFNANPEVDNTLSDVAIIINYEKRIVLIAGSSYCGEIKKSVFTVLNYLLPDKGVLPMHCSANKGKDGDTALLFGLSGTGKTTLSSDPDRPLIGDDEHGWGDDGIFNFEGGCYAKTIRLSEELEPLIFKALHNFGVILENVVFSTRSPVSRISTMPH
jgi:phosphoenolpyruvate carboxykinase (ATP)